MSEEISVDSDGAFTEITACVIAKVSDGLLVRVKRSSLLSGDAAVSPTALLAAARAAQKAAIETMEAEHDFYVVLKVLFTTYTFSVQTHGLRVSHHVIDGTELSSLKAH